MGPWFYMRALVYLKRISIALERIAAANEAVMPQVKKAPKLARVFTPTSDQIREIYEEEREYET